ncbi:MAG: BamA/TamA family outer membrane protein [Bacteroides sp.]|nr:BamA/TamA family outer membrane protein [Bacteroides sp.]
MIDRIITYLSESNCPDTTKRLDISFLGGPFYTRESKLGLGIVAAGLYRKNPADTTKLGSQINLYGKYSITGYYKFGIDGTHFFDDGGSEQIVYDVSFESAPDKYWGIGYTSNRDDDNETAYNCRHAHVDVAFIRSIFLDNLYFGPHLIMVYINARDITKPELWDGQRHHTFTDAIGFQIEYDTRDYKYNSREGIYFSFDQMFAPRFIGNKYAFSSTEICFRTYTPAWTGAIIAINLHSRMTYGNTPWGMMAKIGGNYSMRGFWEGRYNDKCASDFTIELRQHIYRRHGAVAWIGLGEVYDKPLKLVEGSPCFNIGFGYRWEFKKRVNVRVDCGFGKGQCGVIFNINEAF